MQKTRFWMLYVSAYSLLIGVPLMFFPDRAPLVHFAAGDRIWVQFAGMVCIAYSYFNVVLFRERLVNLMRATFVSQAIFAVTVSVTAFALASRVWYLLTAVLLVGTVGSFVSYHAESKSYTPEPWTRMPKTSFWNLYVSIYTACFGFGPLLLPRRIVALMGFNYPEGLWIKFVGMTFLVLSYYNVVTYRDQGPESAMLSILTVRLWFFAVLSWLVLSGNPPFIYAIIATVLIGLVGTINSYRKEKRTMAALPASSASTK